MVGSGRTDAGTHALGQTAHFKSPHSIEARKFLHSLNGILPHDIRIKSVENVPSDFHARYSATGKIYHYFLHLNPILNPFKRLYSLHVYEKINISLLEEASQYFVGVHDFTAFANESHSGVAAHDPIRHLKRLDIIREEEGLRLEFERMVFFIKWYETLLELF